MSWPAVRAWRDALASLDPAPSCPWLSPAGARLIFAAALDALNDEALAGAEAYLGAPWGDAVVVSASTVATASMEWCATLLGRGTAVTLKWPASRPGLGPLLVRVAREVGLPLRGTADRAAVQAGDLVVVMGSDETVAAVRASLGPGQVLAAHGHRFSVAWITRGSWDGVARDLAPHDSRGCMSPVWVLTPMSLERACDALGDAMDAAEARWPRGEVGLGEAAAMRSRGALARVLGVARRGDGFEVHGLPATHAEPLVLPRCPLVVSVPDLAAAVEAVRPFAPWLATVGTEADEEAADPWTRLGASRVCRPGHMQRPPLLRLHDGVDWVAQTVRAQSSG